VLLGRMAVAVRDRGASGGRIRLSGVGSASRWREGTVVTRFRNYSAYDREQVEIFLKRRVCARICGTHEWKSGLRRMQRTGATTARTTFSVLDGWEGTRFAAVAYGVNADDTSIFGPGIGRRRSTRWLSAAGGATAQGRNTNTEQTGRTSCWDRPASACWLRGCRMDGGYSRALSLLSGARRRCGAGVPAVPPSAARQAGAGGNRQDELPGRWAGMAGRDGEGSEGGWFAYVALDLEVTGKVR